jgi:hypothetical protein
MRQHHVRGAAGRRAHGQVTANDEYAAELLAQAARALHTRRVLLTASVALSTSSSIAAARRVLTGWEGGPPGLIAEAVAVIDAIRAETTGLTAREEHARAG